MKKNLINTIIILVSLIGLVIVLFTSHNGIELKALLEKMNIKWLGVAFLCVILGWIAEAEMLLLITHRVCRRENFSDSLKVTMYGQFFNAVTPFSTGGQPAQAFLMVKNGVPVGECANILLFKSIFYQLVIFLYTIIAFMFRGKRMLAMIPNFLTFFIVGITVSFFIILFFGLFIFNTKAAEKVLDFIFHVCRRIKFLRNIESYLQGKESELEKFKSGTQNMMRNLSTIIGTVFFQSIQLTLLFSIPYFIYLAVESDWGEFATMISSQALLRVVTTMVPTPGASGGAEGMSYLFFKNFFRTAPIVPVIIIYRIFTYYINIIFGGAVILFNSNREKKISKESI